MREIDVAPDLAALLGAVAADFPAMLAHNLVGIYLWGSLTCDAFDERCSDVDCIVLTRSDPSPREYARLERWFADSRRRNRWTERLDVRFVIEHAFLDTRSRCCVFQGARLARTGSDANALIPLGLARSGVTVWGRDVAEVVPEVPSARVRETLRLELCYLAEGLAARGASAIDERAAYLSYAVITVCRILFTAAHGCLATKPQAVEWALGTLPDEWQPLVRAAWDQRGGRAGALEPWTEIAVQSLLSHARAVLAEGDPDDPAANK